MISEVLGNPGLFSENLLLHILLDIELLFLAALLIAYPLILFPVFLIGGIVLTVKEGMRPRNILSIALALLLIAFDIVYPFLFDVSRPNTATMIYWYITMISLYLVIQLASYWISALLNLIHIRKDRGLRYVVVLGAGLRGKEPTPLLASRIDRGIRVYRDNPGCRLIFSGGQGKDEQVSEARAMADYALSANVPAEDIILEDRSVNTVENIRFSSDLMDAKKGPFAVVTSSYHLMRALLIARRLKLKCTGYGARTRLYFSLNAFLREYVAYFRDNRYLCLIQLAGLTLLYIAFWTGIHQ
ncbi:MAG: YdcF family protein [Lachnospiraceae bacterium]|nr:YdcF family protein [Lachnospiraceae bacterium]